MLIIAKYNNSAVVVDTATKTWRHATEATEEIEAEILRQVYEGELTEAPLTQAEIAEATRLSYK